MQTATPTHAVIRTIEMGFIFEDGVAKAVPVEWARGKSVLDALKNATHKPHGIKFRVSGEYRSSFVTEIDDQPNDAGGNWMYWVNGELANRGCGEYLLKPGDVVRWEFVPFDPKAR